jgi:hypothetical protein
MFAVQPDQRPWRRVSSEEVRQSEKAALTQSPKGVKSQTSCGRSSGAVINRERSHLPGLNRGGADHCAVGGRRDSSPHRSYLSVTVLNCAAIFKWCNSQALPEDVVHVCLAGKSTPESNLSRQHPRLSK